MLRFYEPILQNHTSPKMKNLIIIIFLLITTTVFSQKREHFVIPDSLKKMSFEVLEKRFNDSFLDKEKKTIYAKSYYKKSKLQKDYIIIANGMYLLANSKNDKIALKYADSIIALTKKRKDFFYPAKGYILKSDYLLLIDHLDEALSNILEAEKHSIKNRNLEQNILVKQQIGVIKIKLGKFEEALPLIKANYNYFKSKDTRSVDFIYSSLMLSEIYIRLKKPDVALNHINDLLKNLKPNNPYYKYFIMYKGITYNVKKEYVISNELLDKAIIMLKSSEDLLSLAICYYYRGENIFQTENNLNKSKEYFEKVDSILVKTKRNSLDLRDNYIRLIGISKKLNDNKQQLYYLNRLIEIDAYLNKNDITLEESINKNYDTPHLLSEKETIISKINQEKQIYIGMGLVVFAGLAISLYYLSKTKREKQLSEERFSQLMLTTNERNKGIPIKETSTNFEENKKIAIDLPIEKANEILKKLAVFEKNKGYLEPNINQADFAKQLDTNSTYLSRTINQYENKNFSKYLNDLRIEYTITRLKEDKKFRKYSIKSIADEVGFSNSESFAKAFRNTTGFQPSVFINKIQEIQDAG
jgi:AraC-like DNA-binding protein